MTAVLDASALLALLRGEPGAHAVEETLEGSVVSAVNWSELQRRLLAHGVEIDSIRADVETLGVTILPFDVDDAERAARLAPATAHAGLSLGGRACLALAQRLGVPAVTADRLWGQLELGIEIRVIR